MNGSPRSNVRLHIERLVLDGVPLRAGQSAKLRAAVEAELTRLLSAGSLAAGLAGGGAVPTIRTRDVSLADAGTPVEPSVLGERIARSVYGGIGQ